jgi:hypothetical protein
VNGEPILAIRDRVFENKFSLGFAGVSLATASSASARYSAAAMWSKSPELILSDASLASASLVAALVVLAFARSNSASRSSISSAD